MNRRTTKKISVTYLDIIAAVLRQNYGYAKRREGKRRVEVIPVLEGYPPVIVVVQLDADVFLGAAFVVDQSSAYFRYGLARLPVLSNCRFIG